MLTGRNRTRILSARHANYHQHQCSPDTTWRALSRNYSGWLSYFAESACHGSYPSILVFVKFDSSVTFARDVMFWDGIKQYYRIEMENVVRERR